MLSMTIKMHILNCHNTESCLLQLNHHDHLPTDTTLAQRRTSSCYLLGIQSSWPLARTNRLLIIPKQSQPSGKLLENPETSRQYTRDFGSPTGFTWVGK